MNKNINYDRFPTRTEQIQDCKYALVSSLKFSIITTAIVMIFLGCASLEVTAYRTTGSVVYSVDKAMSAWGDFVRAGRATDRDEFIVRAAYLKYQKALSLERSVLVSYKKNSDKTALNKALSALTDAANEIVDLIVSFMPEMRGSSIIAVPNFLPR